MKKYKHRLTFTVNGKRHNVYTDSDNPRVQGQLIEQKRREIEQRRPRSAMPFREWAEKCVEVYKTNQKPITREKYLNRMRCCILSQIGDIPLRDIMPMDCQITLNAQAGKSKRQIDEVYQTLRFLFRHAVENGLISADPSALIVKPAGTKTHRRALTQREREAVLAVAKTDRRYYLYLLMLLCGCRPSEAENVRGSDIKIENGVRLLHIKGTKNAGADRFVPIPAKLYAIIKNTPKDEFIACTRAGNKIGQNRERVWQSFKRQLNIYLGCKVYRNQLIPPYPLAPDLVPYCLRHEYCTNLARHGVDIRVAQKLMGHTSIKMTAEIYTHVDADMIADVAAIID